MTRRAWVLLAGLWAVVAAHGQDLRGFVRYGPAEGLPSNVLTRVLQDRRGLLWIGTQEGLVRFDGNTFRPFPADAEHPHALGDPFVRALARDDGDGFYVGTSLGGLQHFDARSERFTRIPLGPRGDSPVRALLTQPGVVWAATRDGLFRYDARRHQAVRMERSEDVEVLAAGLHGEVWAASAGALFRSDIPGGLRKVPLPAGTRGLTSILFQPDGTMWLGTDGGVLVGHPGGPFRLRLASAPVSSRWSR